MKKATFKVNGEVRGQYVQSPYESNEHFMNECEGCSADIESEAYSNGETNIVVDTIFTEG